MDNYTLYISNLREPIARTISHYKYDQRWSCGKLRKGRMIPTENNTKSTLERFITKKDKRHSERFLWSCATNCYTRWVTGNFKRLAKTCSNKLRRKEVKRINQAREMLLKYNLIIITDNMRDPDYVARIESMFNVPGLINNRHAVCTGKSKAANEMVPLVITNGTRRLLEDCNTPDSVLYKQLTTCPNGFEFPQYNRSRFH